MAQGNLQTINDLFIAPGYCKTLETTNTGLKIENSTVEEAIPLKIEVSNPGKLLKLIENLDDECTKKLEVKLNRYLKVECSCRYVFLINMFNLSQEAIVQVMQENILEINIKTNFSDETMYSILEYQTKNTKKFNNLDSKLQLLIKTVVCEELAEVVVIPILEKRKNAQPLHLVCIVNPSKDSTYVSKIVSETFRFCLPIFLNTRKREEERRLKAECQKLLVVTSKLFSHVGSFADLLKDIMSEARKLTNAEHCLLFLLNPDLMQIIAKKFIAVDSMRQGQQVRISAEQGIAGHVAATGEFLNIKDIHKQSFYKKVDEALGIKVRNILCFPLKDEDNVVGVAQLWNKFEGHFDYYDEQIANAFSNYCGKSILHSFAYKKMQDDHVRNKLSNETRLYHMHVDQQDVLDIVMCQSNHDVVSFSQFSFVPRKILPKEAPCYIIKMMKELGFMDTFRIKIEYLTRFILYIEKAYSKAPYHNFSRGFAAAHFAYCAIKNFQLVEKDYLSQLEAMAYFISCLCHDVDYRGATNNFQEEPNSILSSFCSSEGSVMERHQLSQTICILNTEGCFFLDYLSNENYAKFLELMKDMILATDLATHYRIHSRQLTMAQEKYNKKSSEHRYYLVSLLMTCADLSDYTKDWKESKKVAQWIYAEFFAQEAPEKANKSTKKIPIAESQIEFLTQCCLCIFRILVLIFPNAKVLVDTIKKNIMCWETTKHIFEKLTAQGKSSYEVLVSDELESEVQRTLDSLNE